jgi:hypothetical protein
MSRDIGRLRQRLEGLRGESLDFLNRVDQIVEVGDFSGNALWFRVPSEEQAVVNELRKNVGQTMAAVAEAVQGSPLIGEADLSGLSQNLKHITESLRFYRYQYYPQATIYVEDLFKGIQPASESNDDPISLQEAREIVIKAYEAIEDLLDRASADELQSASDDVEEPTPRSAKARAPSPRGKRGRRGPKVDHASHLKVAEIASRINANLEDENDLFRFCEELDKEEIPIPNAWRQWPEKPSNWVDALGEAILMKKKRVVRQAIEYRIDEAKTAKQ